MEQEVHSLKVCMFVILEIEFGIQLGGGEQYSSLIWAGSDFQITKIYFHSELCYGNIMKNYFFSQNVLPHDQQQQWIRLFQTATIIKAEIHSNTSMRNKCIHCFGEDLGKLSCSKYQRSAAIVLSLSCTKRKDRSVCSGINITAIK